MSLLHVGVVCVNVLECDLDNNPFFVCDLFFHSVHYNFVQVKTFFHLLSVSSSTPLFSPFSLDC